MQGNLKIFGKTIRQRAISEMKMTMHGKKCSADEAAGYLIRLADEYEPNSVDHAIGQYINELSTMQMPAFIKECTKRA